MKTKTFKVEVENEIMENALSVGWHLAKIYEADPEILESLEQWEKFSKWLRRHFNTGENIKKMEEEAAQKIFLDDR